MSPTPCRRGAIELKRAELILRALNTAVGNIKRVKFDLHAHEMVREIPNNPAPPTEEVDEAARRANRAESARPTAAYLAECRAELEKQSPHAGAKHGNPTNITPTSGKRKYESSDTLHATAGWGDSQSATGSCRNSHPGCPGAPELPGCSAVAPTPTPTAAAKVIARKPTASGKAEAPRERKPAAHRASFSRN